MDTYESILLVKNEVFVFKIPPLKTNRGYKAADWNLQEPQWTGRMRLVSKGNDILLKLEDKNSGELFAKCPIDTYPGLALESVTDSSRYFVVRIQDDSGRNAFIGLGFGDRSDSFDLNVALQDHFKWLKNQKQAETAGPQQELDLSFKDGETIKINMKITKKDGSEALSRAKPKPGSGSGLLPPPPGAPRIPPPSPQHAASSPSNPSTTEWGEYSSGSTTDVSTPATHSGVSPNNSNWVQF